MTPGAREKSGIMMDLLRAKMATGIGWRDQTRDTFVKNTLTFQTDIIVTSRDITIVNVKLKHYFFFK